VNRAAAVCRAAAGRAAGRALRTITDAAIDAVIVKTLKTTPAGETHWSTRGMAKAAGLSHATIGRIWRTFGLQPHVTDPGD
jgi:hypothetical protein